MVKYVISRHIISLQRIEENDYHEDANKIFTINRYSDHYLSNLNEGAQYYYG